MGVYVLFETTSCGIMDLSLELPCTLWRGCRNDSRSGMVWISVSIQYANPKQQVQWPMESLLVSWGIHLVHVQWHHSCPGPAKACQKTYRMSAALKGTSNNIIYRCLLHTGLWFKKLAVVSGMCCDSLKPAGPKTHASTRSRSAPAIPVRLRHTK